MDSTVGSLWKIKMPTYLGKFWHEKNSLVVFLSEKRASNHSMRVLILTYGGVVEVYKWGFFDLYAERVT